MTPSSTSVTRSPVPRLPASLGPSWNSLSIICLLMLLPVASAKRYDTRLISMVLAWRTRNARRNKSSFAPCSFSGSPANSAETTSASDLASRRMDRLCTRVRKPTIRKTGLTPLYPSKFLSISIQDAPSREPVYGRRNSSRSDNPARTAAATAPQSSSPSANNGRKRHS
ncbi:hypothetical protein D3C73_631130 [compost metagenome]